MAGQPSSYAQFLRRYNELKTLYFSPRSDPRYDADNEEIPSAFMSKAQIIRAFNEDLRVRVPVHRQDPPTFFDGTVGPAWVPEDQ